MSTYIYQCQACPATICQTNSDTPVCQEGKRFANWTKIEPKKEPAVDDMIPVISLDDAMRIVEEKFMHKRSLIFYPSDYEARKVLCEMRAHSFLAKPVGLQLSRKDAD